MNPIKSILYRKAIPFLGLLNRGQNRFVNVIYYHDVVPAKGESYMRINIDLFRQQMEYIAQKGYKTTRFDDFDQDASLVEYSTDRLLITFDDGWLSNYSSIFSMMKNLGLKYNIFLETAKIGVAPDYLSWEQAKEMHESGLVGFGAHTFTHPNMSETSNYDLKKEIYDVNEIIRNKLGIHPQDFCFPFGAYSQESLRQIAETGEYKRIYTSDMDYSYSLGNVIVMGRNAISNDEPFEVFKGKTSGYYNIYKSLTRK